MPLIVRLLALLYKGCKFNKLINPVVESPIFRDIFHNSDRYPKQLQL